jgi:hypothetical protein
MANATCLSCNHELEPPNRKNVPMFVDCCGHCWRQIPIVDRLRLSIEFRDRTPGGYLNELADLLNRMIIELQKQPED